METKICTKCEQAKPLDEMTKCSKSPDGRGSYCKECHRAYTKEWTSGNEDRVKATRKAYNRNNAEKISERNKVYKAENRDYFLEYNRRYANEKPEKALLYEARKRAKKFGLPITIADTDIVIPEFCPILGIKLVRGSADDNRDACPSLDRVNPELGYVPGNIAVISYRANRIKNNGTSEEHRRIADWMDQVSQIEKELVAA
jgi:hypothetical protein